MTLKCSQVGFRPWKKFVTTDAFLGIELGRRQLCLSIDQALQKS